MSRIAAIALLAAVVAAPLAAQPGPGAPPFHSIPPVSRAFWATVFPVAGGVLIYNAGEERSYLVAGTSLVVAGILAGPYAGYAREGDGRDARGWAGLAIRGGTVAALWACGNRCDKRELYAGAALAVASDLYDILWLRGKEAIPPRAPRYGLMPYFDPGSRAPGLSLRIAR